MIDIHCHILPKLDDGPTTEDEALDMARIAVDDGITDIVCTPHHLPGLYPTRSESIKAAVRSLQDLLDSAGIALTLHPGMEIHVSAADPEDLHQGKLLSLNNHGTAVLIEFPHQFVPQNMDTLFWTFLSRGIQPVLAHVERYPGLLSNPSPLEKWVHMGIMTQVTASSLLGRFGPDVEDFAWRLIESNLAHVLATDAHSPDFRRPQMREASAVAENRLGLDVALNLVLHRPRDLIQGRSIDLPDPLPLTETDTPPGFVHRILGWMGKR
ncbi:MAG: CpsB/CapC family capsule biosynthesis tyrosine phosphatase [Desulfovermiculus sp.]|nr:CpsB/CapC family capsule biosynthesis tyrosine phosphatase [Desulfovermiculus sp.]